MKPFSTKTRSRRPTAEDAIPESDLGGGKLAELHPLRIDPRKNEVTFRLGDFLSLVSVIGLQSIVGNGGKQGWRLDQSHAQNASESIVYRGPKPAIKSGSGSPADGFQWQHGTRTIPGMPPRAHELATFLYYQDGKSASRSAALDRLHNTGDDGSTDPIRGAINKFNEFCRRHEIANRIETTTRRRCSSDQRESWVRLNLFEAPKGRRRADR